MRIALTALATAVTLAGTALAEPAKPNAPATPQPQLRPSVVLASAENVRTPNPSVQPSPPVKRPRVARVTSCRCGDPAPEGGDQ